MSDDKPWFDLECKESKQNILRLGKMVKRLPNDTRIREELFFKKREFRKMLKSKKFNHRKIIVDKMCESMSNGVKKDYWKFVKKLQNKSPQESMIPDRVILNHYKNILIDDDVDLENIPMDEGVGCLD